VGDEAADRLAGRHLTLPEAAARLNVNRRTLNYAVKMERLPAERIGNAWMVRPEDVGAWIASDKHMPARAPKTRRSRQQSAGAD
jgi:excisionase family DNA binding protein